MKYVKKIAVILLITLITICAVFISYTGIKNGAVVFATNQDGTLTNDELDVALSSWLESHGGNIFSPQNYRARKTYESGILHNFIYGDGGGYDSIRQHINGGVGGNNELRFDLDGFIIQKLNTWLNRELQNGTFGNNVQLDNNGMFVDGTDNELYSGKYYNNKLVWIVTETGSKPNDSFIIQKGSYVIDKSTALSLTSNGSYYYTYHAPDNSSYSYYLRRSTDTYYNVYGTYILMDNKPFASIDNNTINDGGCIYLFNLSNNSFSFGVYRYVPNQSNCYIISPLASKLLGSNNTNVEDVDINFYTNNNNNISVYPSINNDTDIVYITPKVNVGVDGQVNYQPYIVNEGDNISNVINNYYQDSNTPDNTISVPSDTPSDPSGGGGGGNNDNPSGGTPPNWSNPYPSLNPDGNGGFNFNFTLPDLNIDWNISGLTEKFPFSIPFDFLAFCRVLNAEPQVPEWSGTLVLPMYSHQFTFSLQQFNSVAVILRNLEFIGFCIGLILATRSLIKG